MKNLNIESRFFLLLTVIALSACGCNQNPDPPAELTLVMSADSGDYNPLSQNFSWIGANFVGGPLMRLSPNGDWEPWVAKSVEWRGFDLVIKLADRSHSDETPVTADDVVYSLAARADPKIGGSSHQLFNDHGFSTASKVSESEVLVRFNSFWAPARNFIRGQTVWKKSLLERIAQSDSPQNFRVTATDLIGSGPYSIVESVPNSYIVAAPTAGGERLRIRTAAEGAARRILFAEGQADVMYIDQQQERSFRKLATVMNSRFRDPVCLVMNMDAQSTTGSRPDLRLALLLATDPEVLRKTAINGNSLPGNGQLFSGNLTDWNHPDASTIVAGFDPIEANRLLDRHFPLSLGRRTTPNGDWLKLKLVTYDLPLNKIMSDRLAYELRRHLKIDISVEQISVSRFFDVMFHRDYAIGRNDWDLSIMAWPVALSSANDPSQAQSLLGSSIPPDGFNIANLADEKLDDLINAADTEPNETERHARYHKVHSRLLDLAVVKPICHVYTTFAVSERVVGYSPDEANFETLATRWPERLRLKSSAP